MLDFQEFSKQILGTTQIQKREEEGGIIHNNKKNRGGPL